MLRVKSVATGRIYAMYAMRHNNNNNNNGRYLFVSVPCAGLGWRSRQILSAR